MSRSYGSVGFKAFAITLAVIITAACVAGGITYSMGMWGGSDVPDVVGMTRDDAEEALKDAGFKAEFQKEPSDEEKGTVVSTDPPAGMRADASSTIIVMVATPYTVPKVVGMMIDEATAALDEAGFSNIEIVERASDEESGKVLMQDPKSGNKVKSDAAISLTVAVPHTVPDVAGMSETEAKSAIANAGYKYRVTSEYSDSVEQGKVLGTTPQASSPLASQSTVEIKVAKSRARELEATGRKYLESLSRVRINGKNYEVSSVDDVTFTSDDACSFTLTARQFESHSWFGGEPETRYGNNEKITGTISFSRKGKVESSDPPIEAVS